MEMSPQTKMKRVNAMSKRSFIRQLRSQQKSLARNREVSRNLLETNVEQNAFIESESLSQRKLFGVHHRLKMSKKVYRGLENSNNDLLNVVMDECDADEDRRNSVEKQTSMPLTL